MTKPGLTTTPAGFCPSCGRPTEEKYRPFCSPRCKDVDLGRWFTESYRIPGAPVESEDDDQSIN